MAVDIVPTKLDGTDLRIGIVVARFNEYAGRGEFESCMDELRKLGVMDEDVTKVSVPGALEIPVCAAKARSDWRVRCPDRPRSRHSR